MAAIRVTIVDAYQPQFKAALESIAGGAQNAQEIAAVVLKEAAEDPDRNMPSRK